jgi:hypothetical protein
MKLWLSIALVPLLSLPSTLVRADSARDLMIVTFTHHPILQAPPWSKRVEVADKPTSFVLKIEDETLVRVAMRPRHGCRLFLEVTSSHIDSSTPKAWPIVVSPGSRFSLYLREGWHVSRLEGVVSGAGACTPEQAAT